MEEVLRYLELKNHYYEKFYSLSLRFLEQTAKNNWDELENFIDNRERILSIIHSYDHKIAQQFSSLRLSREEIEQYRLAVKSMLDRRIELGQKIIELDLELVSRMEEIRSETIKELKHSVELSNQLNSFAPTTRRPLKARNEV